MPSQPKSRTRQVKIVVLGAGAVGKSALTLQMVHQVFVEVYDRESYDRGFGILISLLSCACAYSVIEYHKVMAVDDQLFNIELVDTAGVEQFLALHELYMKSGDGFILVFSLTDVDSVNQVTPLRSQIVRLKDLDGIPEKAIPMVLVGNKCDLKAERQVSRDVGIALSTLWNNCPYYETSARRRINIDEVLEDVVRQIMKRDATLGLNRSERKKHRRCIIL